jgi:hypothetical protein
VGSFSLAPRTIFVMYQLTDPKLHRAFNEHHQLDHRPANLALDGIAWGERWVRSPECAAVSEAPDPVLRDMHYLNSYWIKPPIEENIVEFHDLGERTFQAGRQFTAREWGFQSYFQAVYAYANPRIAVSSDILPIRPNTGVYVSIWQVETSTRDARAHTLFQRDREVHFPELMAIDGVAGGYILASDDYFAGPRRATRRGADAEAATGYRAHLLFLDGDPIESGSALVERERSLVAEDSELADVRRLLLASPFLAITPWQWDWFDSEIDHGAD